MARAKKVNDSERLDDASIERVIKYLGEKGATKKNACAILNIAYNTTRLDKLIEGYKFKKEEDARRRSEKRGKPATIQEIDYVVTEYLAGQPISKIAAQIYRGTTFVNSILEEYAVPQRNNSQDYFHPKLIPEEASREAFVVGEKVYSARYDTLAEVEKELDKLGPNGEKVYRVYLRGDWQQYANQPAYELASLQKLRTAGINI